MKKYLLMGLVSLSLTACNLTNTLVQSEKTTELHTSLSHWNNVYDDGIAELVNDEIHLISKGNWFFLSKEKYSDFIFEAEVLMPDTDEYSNSGFIFRAQTRPNKHNKDSLEAYGYQAEVDPSKRRWSGGLYDQGRRQWLNPLHEKRSHPDADFIENKSKEWGEEKLTAYKHLEWNKYKIICKGSDIKIYVNGVLTTHVIDVKDTEGHIGIQHHGSKKFKLTGDKSNVVRFKNIKITEL